MIRRATDLAFPSVIDRTAVYGVRSAPHTVAIKACNTWITHSMTSPKQRKASRPVTVRAVLGGPFPPYSREDAQAVAELLHDYIHTAITRHPSLKVAELRGYLVTSDITVIRRDLGQRWQPSVVRTCATLLRAVFASRDLVLSTPPSSEIQPMSMQRTDQTQRAHGRATYYSLTLWQRGDWLLEVHYGSFESEDDADDFSAADLALGFNGCLWLHHPYGTSLIAHEDLQIYRRLDLREMGATAYGIADLQRYVDVAEMRCIAQSHGLHKSGVGHDNVVALDFTEAGIELGEEISANDDAIGVSHVS